MARNFGDCVLGNLGQQFFTNGEVAIGGAHAVDSQHDGDLNRGCGLVDDGLYDV